LAGVVGGEAAALGFRCSLAWSSAEMALKAAWRSSAGSAYANKKYKKRRRIIIIIKADLLHLSEECINVGGGLLRDEIRLQDARKDAQQLRQVLVVVAEHDGAVAIARWAIRRMNSKGEPRGRTI